MLRTAALAGGGAALYHAGKKSQAGADDAYMQGAQDQQMQAEQAPAPMPAAPAPAGPSEDAIARLKQLGELHDQGVLTDEEFAAEKAKILG